MHFKVTATNEVSGESILSDATKTHVATRETHITLKTPLTNLDRFETKDPKSSIPHISLHAIQFITKSH
jgi:hypothetical protein